MKKIIMVITVLLFSLNIFALTTTVTPLTVTKGNKYEFNINLKTNNTQKDKILTITIPDTYPLPSLSSSSPAFISIITKGKLSSIKISGHKIIIGIKYLKANSIIKIKYGSKIKGGKGITAIESGDTFTAEIDGVTNTVKITVR